MCFGYYSFPPHCIEASTASWLWATQFPLSKVKLLAGAGLLYFQFLAFDGTFSAELA